MLIMRRRLAIVLLITLLFLHGPLGGLVTQTAISVGSYLGVSIGSLFNQQLRTDLQAINYNPFNHDEVKALAAANVTFYRGVAIYKAHLPRSGSFGAVILDRDSTVASLRHEYGHTRQLIVLGPLTYLLLIGVPSFGETSHRHYYDRPWEITADLLGGVTEREHSSADCRRGEAYLAVSATLGPVGYFFLCAEF